MLPLRHQICRSRTRYAAPASHVAASASDMPDLGLEGISPAAAARIWTTLLVIESLGTLRFGWLADPVAENCTIVDRAMEWLLEAQRGAPMPVLVRSRIEARRPILAPKAAASVPRAGAAAAAHGAEPRGCVALLGLRWSGRSAHLLMHRAWHGARAGAAASITVEPAECDEAGRVPASGVCQQRPLPGRV